jgi:DnaJ-class molecular chaperone
VQAGSGKDPYATLGVARDADADTIKKAYRKLAQKYHPDRNADAPDAEENFKRVSSAYAVLSDEKRKAAYDEFGEIALDPGFDVDKAREASRGFGGGFGGFGQTAGGQGFGGGGFQDAGGFGSLFEDLFTGGGRGPSRAPRQRRGADLETTIVLDFGEAILGAEKRLDFERPAAAGGTRRETLTVRIPPGVEDGARIRLAGKGQEGSQGGPPGDLFARIQVRAHAFLERQDRDLVMEAPISIAEAVGGAAIEIPTLDGRVTLQVPEGTDGGSRLRLRGKGVPAQGGKPAGDLYVTLRIRVPKDLPAESRKQLESLLEDDADEWRRKAFS